MRIDKIEIENFRGFKGQHTLTLQPDINVFVGTNGAGKSSVLDLIGMFLSELTQSFTDITTWLRISREDVSHGTDQTINYANFSTNNTKLFNDKNIKIELIQSPFYTSPQYILKAKNTYFRIEEKDLYEKRINIPIYKYFGIDDKSITDLVDNSIQNKSNHSEDEKELNFNQLNTYKEVYNKRTEYSKFVKWFIEQENSENREKLRAKNLDYEIKSLKILRKAINGFGENFNNTKFGYIRVENEKKLWGSSLQDLCIDRNGARFSFEQLSTGERAILLMISKIVRELETANPSLENPLQGTGIVLIDEIEAHLHPAWQRDVLPALHKIFPNIQFFATTHSPQVISSIDRKNVFIIDDFKFYKAPYTYGRDSNSLLNDVFNVTERPKEAQEDFDELYKFIDDPETVKEATAKLKELTAKYGVNDPEIKRAHMHFEFLTAKPIN